MTKKTRQNSNLSVNAVLGNDTSDCHQINYKLLLSFLSWSIIFPLIILTPWGKIFYGAPDWEWFILLSFPNNRTNSTKLLSDCLVAHSRLNRYTVLFLTSFDSSLLLPMVGERLDERNSVDTCAIYTQKYLSLIDWLQYAGARLCCTGLDTL